MWNEITLAEQAGDESHRRWQEALIVMITCTFVTTILAGIAAFIWGPSEYFLFIIPSWIVAIPIYSWLEGKLSKKLNRRNEA